MPGSQQATRLLRLTRVAHRRVVYPALDFLLPTDCFACRRPLGPVQHLGACAVCWCGFRLLRPPVCPRCGLPRPAGTDLLGPARGRCASCVLDPPIIDGVRAVVVYDELARSFLLRAKLRPRLELFGSLGRLLARGVVLDGFAERCTRIVPVPSHPWVTLRRGFSPGLELARSLASRSGLPIGRGFLRRRLSSPLAGKRLSARGRRAAAASAFRADARARDERVLLVDDVMTTGVTLEAAAAALRAAGAVDVRGAVWARALPS